MSNPPLSQAKILEYCSTGAGFSLLGQHAHFQNYSGKLKKLLDKGLIRLAKRLGDNGGVYVSR